MSLALVIVKTLLFITAAPLVAGIIKTSKARLQNRRGPGIFQVYYDLFKLLGKDIVVSPTASWIFPAAPYIFFAAIIAGAGVLTVWYTDFFILVYLFAVGRFFLALASLDTGSAFGGMGGSREMYLSVLAEPAFLLAMLPLAFKAKSTSLILMINTAATLPFSLSYVFAALAFYIVLITETGRIPVDNPDTHLELTMIHEGMVLEYSGRYLGLIFWASAIKQLIIIMIYVLFFLPWNFGITNEVLLVLLLFFKVLLVAWAIAFTETFTNKMRLLKVSGFLAVSYLLSLLALVAQ